MQDSLRIAQWSSASAAMIRAGSVDVLVGDWLAETTTTELVLEACLDRRVKVILSAAGLDPAACAEAAQSLARRLGWEPVVASLEGDDRSAGLDELGCWGFASALEDGADIVVGGRTTERSMVMAAAAWRFGWWRDDWNQLAGACVAGSMMRPDFPMVEVFADGSSVTTKQPGRGGVVTVSSITEQLLGEVDGLRSRTPDVVARVDTVFLLQEGTDQVRVLGVRGEPPTLTGLRTNALTDRPLPSPPGGPTRRAPIGAVAKARSSRRAEHVSISLWARSPEAFAWLRSALTLEHLRGLLPEACRYRVDRYELPNLLALHFVLPGLDIRVEGLCDHLRASLADIPEELMSSCDRADVQDSTLDCQPSAGSTVSGTGRTAAFTGV